MIDVGADAGVYALSAPCEVWAFETCSFCIRYGSHLESMGYDAMSIQRPGGRVVNWLFKKQVR